MKRRRQEFRLSEDRRFATVSLEADSVEEAEGIVSDVERLAVAACGLVGAAASVYKASVIAGSDGRATAAFTFRGAVEGRAFANLLSSVMDSAAEYFAEAAEFEELCSKARCDDWAGVDKAAREVLK